MGIPDTPTGQILSVIGLDVAPASLTLTPDGIEQVQVGIEQDFTLEGLAAGARYLVGNTELLAVTPEGLVTALGEGETDLTVIHGFAERVIPIRIESANLGATVLDKAGGVVSNADGYTVAVAPNSLAEETLVNIETRSQADLPLDLPDSFGFGAAFELDLGEQRLNNPVELAIPVDPRIEPGTQVWFFQPGEVVGLQ